MKVEFDESIFGPSGDEVKLAFSDTSARDRNRQSEDKIFLDNLFLTPFLMLVGQIWWMDSLPWKLPLMIVPPPLQQLMGL